MLLSCFDRLCIDPLAARKLGAFSTYPKQNQKALPINRKNKKKQIRRLKALIRIDL